MWRNKITWTIFVARATSNVYACMHVHVHRLISMLEKLLLLFQRHAHNLCLCHSTLSCYTSGKTRETRRLFSFASSLFSSTLPFFFFFLPILRRFFSNRCAFFIRFHTKFVSCLLSTHNTASKHVKNICIHTYTGIIFHFFTKCFQGRPIYMDCK